MAQTPTLPYITLHRHPKGVKYAPVVQFNPKTALHYPTLPYIDQREIDTAL